VLNLVWYLFLFHGRVVISRAFTLKYQKRFQMRNFANGCVNKT